MLQTLVSLADLWIGRRAAPQPGCALPMSRASSRASSSRGPRAESAMRSRRDLRARGGMWRMVARKAGALEEAAASMPRANGLRVLTLPLDVTEADTPARLETSSP